MDAGQRPGIAEIVEILADGLRRDLETAGEVFDHHPAESAGDIENLVLAMGQAGHDDTMGTRKAPWCDRSGIRSTRQIGRVGGPMAESPILVKAVPRPNDARRR